MSFERLLSPAGAEGKKSTPAITVSLTLGLFALTVQKVVVSSGDLESHEEWATEGVGPLTTTHIWVAYQWDRDEVELTHGRLVAPALNLTREISPDQKMLTGSTL